MNGLDKYRLPMILGTVVIATLLLAAACGDDGAPSASTAPSADPTSRPTETPTVPSMTLQGGLTLDGEPLNAEFLGVRVIRDGLVTACQNAIPTVTDGRYEIPVAFDDEVGGCGAPESELLLWTYTDDTYLFSTQAIRWPDEGSTLMFDAAFSSDNPAGASKPVTEFKGHLFANDGSELPGGTVVEAFVGDVRCAVTSLRPGDVVEGFYTLVVVGPESVEGCDRGAEITFRLDGKPAAETAINEPGGMEGSELDLTLQ